MATPTYEEAIASAAEVYRAWRQEAAYQSAEQIADAALVPGGPSRDELIATVNRLRAAYQQQHNAA